MPKQKRKETLKVIPIPSSDTQGEHDRVRKSNDRDQQLEREGKVSCRADRWTTKTVLNHEGHER